MAKKVKAKKSKIKKDYVWWAVLGMLIQYGIPVSYIIWTYDVFKFEERSLTGWGIILIAIVLILVRNKVQDFVVDYNKHLSITAKRGKWGFTFLIVALFLMLSQYWIETILIFFLVLAASNLLSLVAYAPYDRKKKDYIELKEMLEEKRKQEKMKGLSV